MFPLSLILLQEARLRDFQLVLLHLADVLFALRLLSLLLLLLLLLLFGSVHLSMPRHDYVKSNMLAMTDKTKPIYIFNSYSSRTHRI